MRVSKRDYPVKAILVRIFTVYSTVADEAPTLKMGNVCSLKLYALKTGAVS